MIFLIPQAVAQNFATLIVSRFFAGAFGATVQNAAANVTGDMWESEVGRSFSITLFCMTYLGGFTLGPVRSPDTYEYTANFGQVFSGAVLSGLHWRW